MQQVVTLIVKMEINMIIYISSFQWRYVKYEPPRVDVLQISFGNVAGQEHAEKSAARSHMWHARQVMRGKSKVWSIHWETEMSFVRN